MSCSAASGCSLPCREDDLLLGARCARRASAGASTAAKVARASASIGASLHRGAPAGSAPAATASIAFSIGMWAMPLARSTQP